MVKPPQQSKPEKKPSLFYQTEEWRVQYRNGYSEIEIQGASVAQVTGNHHVDIAEFIATSVNTHNQKIDQYAEAIKALEICLESKGLSWEAEQAADIAVRRSEKSIAPMASHKTRIPVKKLTARELEVITHTAYGKNRGDIAQTLHLSEETVKVYVERICRKLHATNKTHAAILAFSLGLIESCEFENIEINKRTESVPHTGNAPAQKNFVSPKQSFRTKNN